MLPVLEGSLGRSLIGKSMILSISHNVSMSPAGEDVPGPKDIEKTREKMKILAIPAIPVDVFE